MVLSAYFPRVDDLPSLELHNVICVGGAPSSGTTLLADYLDSVPGMLCGPEANIFCSNAAYAFDATFRRKAVVGAAFPCNAIYAPRTRFFNLRYASEFGVDSAWLKASVATHSSLPEFTNALAQRFAWQRGRECRVLAEKTPINIGYIGNFLSAFPQGRFVWVVRDGRAVLHSLHQRGYPLIEAAMIWLYQNALAEPWQHHPRVHVVRFEDLVRRPAKIAKALAEAAGLMADEDAIERAFADNDFRDALPRVASWGADGRKPDPGRLEAWRHTLDRNDIAMVERLSISASGLTEPLHFSKFLQRFGYKPATTVNLTVTRQRAAAAVAVYAEKSSNLDVQAPFTVRIGRHSFKMPSRTLLALDSSSPAALDVLLSALRILPVAREEVDGFEAACWQALTALGTRCWLEPKRTYELRVTAHDCRWLAEKPARLVEAAPMLVELFLDLLARRAVVKQGMNQPDAAVLVLGLREYRRIAGREAEHETVLFARAREILPEGWAEEMKTRDVPEPLLASVNYLRLVRSALQENMIPKDRLGRLDPIEAVLLELMSPNGSIRADASMQLVREHLDLRNGMLIAGTSTKEGARKFYTRPLALLALLRMIALGGGELAMAPRAQTIALARRTGGAGLPNPQPGERLAAYAQRILSPPQLCGSWKPGPLQTQRIEFEKSVGENLVDALSDRFGLCLRVHPFPFSTPMVLSVRHDVDRLLTREDLDRVLSCERELAIHSSWYFKPETYDWESARILLEAGCEIGYHASSLADGDDGFAAQLRAHLGSRVQGCTFHGGFGSFYWSGRSSLTAVADLGFHYAELPCDLFSHPTLWSHAGRHIYLTPGSVKVQSLPRATQGHIDKIRACRGHAIIEDHPDRFDESLAKLLDELTSAGALSRTVGEHVAVCRAVDQTIASAQWRRLSPFTLSLRLTTTADILIEAAAFGLQEIRCSSQRVTIERGEPLTRRAFMLVKAHSTVDIYFSLTYHSGLRVEEST